MGTILVAVVTLSVAATRAHPAPPATPARPLTPANPAAARRTAATMLRFNTDKENAKIANKSLEFVKIIREDLRRNNDDYALLERQRLMYTQSAPARLQAYRGGGVPRALPPRAAARHPAAPLTRQPHRAPANRKPPRGYPPHFKRLVPLAGDSRRGINITTNQSTINPPVKNSTVFRSYLHPKHFKKIRVDKLKRLIDKGKSRLREIGRAGAATEDPLGEPTGSPALNGATPAPGGAAGAPGGAMTPSESTTTEVPEPASTDAPHVWQTPRWGFTTKPPLEEGNIGKALRQQDMNQSPSPDQLDMAPARGPHVQLIRFKGRLCQRSILNMEGPVYNHDGSTILPMHKPELAYGRQFPQTREPNIILPRCCNCCKKSVLGCQ